VSCNLDDNPGAGIHPTSSRLAVGEFSVDTAGENSARVWRAAGERWRTSRNPILRSLARTARDEIEAEARRHAEDRPSEGDPDATRRG
jgi:hypothetical protein